MKKSTKNPITPLHIPVLSTSSKKSRSDAAADHVMNLLRSSLPPEVLEESEELFGDLNVPSTGSPDDEWKAIIRDISNDFLLQEEATQRSSPKAPPSSRSLNGHATLFGISQLPLGPTDTFDVVSILLKDPFSSSLRCSH